MKYFIKFTSAYFAIALLLYLSAPDSCSNMFCFFEKELVFYFSSITYAVLSVILYLRYLYLKNKTINTGHRLQGTSLTHLILSGILTPIGALVFIVFTDEMNLDDSYEKVFGFICSKSFSCLDIVGDIATLVTAVVVSFSLLFFLPRFMWRLIKNASSSASS